MNDFTTGSVAGKLIRFMMPVLGALVLQAMYGAVDMMIVGHFGSEAGISAVSTASSVTQITTTLITGLTTGVTVIISRYIGEGKKEKLGRVIGGAIAFFLLLSGLLMLILIPLAPQIISLLNAPEEAHDLAVSYIRICGGGIVFVVSYNVISGIFRGMGDSKMPLLFVAIACVVNIFADLLLIAVLKMDVAGAALATIFAQAVSVVLSLLLIRKRKFGFVIKKTDIGLHEEVKNFLVVGFPVALQTFLTDASFLILCSIINSLGLEASSGYGVAQKLVAFVMLLPGALNQTEATIVAQNMGAGKPERAKKSLYCGMGIGAGIGVFVALFVFFRGDLLASLFTSNPAYIEQAASYLKGFAPEAVVTSIGFSFVGYFNGCGRTVFTMIQGLVQTFLVRVPLSWLMSVLPGVTLMRIGLAAPTATVTGIVISVTYFLILRRREKKQLSQSSS